MSDTDGESINTEVDENEPVTPAVEFRGVHFSYDDQKILNDISFKVAKGEIKIILLPGMQQEKEDLSRNWKESPHTYH